MRIHRPLGITLTCAALALTAACGSSSKSNAGGAEGSAAPASSAAAPASPSAAAASSPAASPSPTDNGLTSMTADQILKQVDDAMSAATSMKMDGSVTDSGDTIQIHLDLDTKGNCTGTLGMGAKGSFQMIGNGKQAWLQPDAAFWTSQAGANGSQAAELFKGRWITAADDPDLKDVVSMCDLGAMTSQMADPGDKPTKGSTTTVAGQPAIILHVKSSDGTSSDIYVATTGTPYPYKVDSGTQGSMAFSKFNEPVVATPPSPDQVIDMSKLKSLGGGA
ncbi:hypothetical protein [Kitasatospora sp. LaBMicrA B282]|uniref:hypothetical protein n=1 Tax=Kitasatospora sp. LaBMicrA B282 TaxID=3420949 RepID=UPI003D1062C4